MGVRRGPYLGLALLLLVALAAILSWRLSAPEAPWAEAGVTMVSPAWLGTRLQEAQLRVIDVRWPAQWQESLGKIPGSQWRDSLHTEEWARELPAGTTVVVLCACPAENSSIRVAKRLQELGQRAHVLKGGWQGWLDSGWPIVLKETERPPAPNP